MGVLYLSHPSTSLVCILLKEQMSNCCLLIHGEMEKADLKPMHMKESFVH